MSKQVATRVTTAPRATLAMGAVGAVVGGTVAAARNYGKVKKDEITREAAVKDTLKETGSTGLAAAAGSAVVGAVGVTGLLSLAGFVVVAASAKHLLDNLLEGRPKAVATAETDGESAEKPKKAAKAKTDSSK